MSSDLQRLNDAMQELEQNGYLILTGETCCGGCSYGFFVQKYGNLPDHLDKAVFYTEQDRENVDDWGDMVSSFYLKWAGNSNEICDTVRRHGLLAIHNGDEAKAIEVRPECYSTLPRVNLWEDEEWEEDYEDEGEE